MFEGEFDTDVVWTRAGGKLVAYGFFDSESAAVEFYSTGNFKIIFEGAAAERLRNCGKTE